jgi:hypothetical protein
MVSKLLLLLSAFAVVQLELGGGVLYGLVVNHLLSISVKNGLVLGGERGLEIAEGSDYAEVGWVLLS